VNQTIIVILIIAAAVFAGMSSLAVPAVVLSSAPATEFSAERAMDHIRVVDQGQQSDCCPRHTRK
jgi:hypothetical protein